jgi:cleavage and polyadenylation specificity factor subunit 2
MRDSIVENLRYHKVGDYKVTFVNGQIHLPRPEEMEPGIVPLMDVVTYGQPPGHRAVFIGEMKLSDFKQVLTQAGYRAEFFGGALIVGDGSISLRRVRRYNVPNN